MKKTLSIIAVLVVVAGVASANTIVVPFFNDSAVVGESTGFRSFIGVKNLDNDTITLVITYTDETGLDGTPTNNTFLLGANAAIGWRPTKADSAVEGPNGILVPDADANGTLASGRGGAVISSSGAIVGRVAVSNLFLSGYSEYGAIEPPP